MGWKEAFLDSTEWHGFVGGGWMEAYPHAGGWRMPFGWG